MKIKPVRGTHDLFGEEINKFNTVVAEVKNISQQFGFNELITPIFVIFASPGPLTTQPIIDTVSGCIISSREFSNFFTKSIT